MELTHIPPTPEDSDDGTKRRANSPQRSFFPTHGDMPFVIPKEEREATLLALGRILQHSGVRREIVTIILRETSERYCKPPLSERMLLRLVSRLKWNAHGLSPHTADSSLLPSLLGTRVRQAWDIVEDLPGGVTLLANKPRMGALWLGLGLAITLATGLSTLDALPEREGMVLYLGLNEDQERLYRLAHGWVCKHIADDVSLWETALNASNLNCLERIENSLLQNGSQRLVVIDTLDRSQPVSGKYAEEYDVLGELCSMSKRHKTALLVLHPLPRDGSATHWDKRLAASTRNPIYAFMSIFSTRGTRMQSLTYDEATQRWMMLSYEK